MFLGLRDAGADVEQARGPLELAETLRRNLCWRSKYVYMLLRLVCVVLLLNTYLRSLARAASHC